MVSATDAPKLKKNTHPIAATLPRLRARFCSAMPVRSRADPTRQQDEHAESDDPGDGAFCNRPDTAEIPATAAADALKENDVPHDRVDLPVVECVAAEHGHRAGTGA